MAATTPRSAMPKIRERERRTVFEIHMTLAGAWMTLIGRSIVANRRDRRGFLRQLQEDARLKRTNETRIFCFSRWEFVKGEGKKIKRFKVMTTKAQPKQTRRGGCGTW